MFVHVFAVRCGMCGGDRCVGNGDCCEHTIQARDKMCEDVGVAPCIINKGVAMLTVIILT